MKSSILQFIYKWKFHKKFVKLLDLARVFAALIFLPRDSIGKFFPWAEFSNAWRWFDEIFPALIFLPRGSIGKFIPWAEFSNAWSDLTNFSWKLQKIRQSELFSITVWNVNSRFFSWNVYGVFVLFLFLNLYREVLKFCVLLYWYKRSVYRF